MNKENLKPAGFQKRPTDSVEIRKKSLLKPSTTNDRLALNDIVNLPYTKNKEIAKETTKFRTKSTEIQTNEILQVNQSKRGASLTTDGFSAGESSSSASQSRKSVHFDTKFVTIREDVVPMVAAEGTDDVFIDAEEYFNGAASSSKFGKISPVKPNVFTKSSTVLMPGLREKLSQKKTLMHKINKRQNVELLNEPSTVNEHLYEEEYLEEYIKNVLTEDEHHILRNETVRFNAETVQDRACVLDWLLKVESYNLIPTAVYLKAVRLFDLVLRSTEVSLNMYQLVAMTSIWIMNKYDTSSIYISVKRLISLSGNAYSSSQILRMERKLLKFIDFRCDIPEPTLFVEYFLCKTRIANEIIRYSSYYLLKTFSLSPHFIVSRNSLLGAAVFHLSLEMFEEDTNVWELLKESEVYYAPETMDTMKGFIMRQVLRISKQHFVYQEFNVQKTAFVSAFLAEKIKKKPDL